MRLAQLQWLAFSQVEVESDLSVFHRIRNPHKLTLLKYLQLAELLPAYHGAVAALFRVVLALHQQQSNLPAGVVRPMGARDPVDATVHPLAAGLFD